MKYLRLMLSILILLGSLLPISNAHLQKAEASGSWVYVMDIPITNPAGLYGIWTLYDFDQTVYEYKVESTSSIIDSNLRYVYSNLDTLLVAVPKDTFSIIPPNANGVQWIRSEGVILKLYRELRNIVPSINITLPATNQSFTEGFNTKEI